MFTRQIFTEEHELFREQVRRFVEREITPTLIAPEPQTFAPHRTERKALCCARA